MQFAGSNHLVPIPTTTEKERGEEGKEKGRKDGREGERKERILLRILFFIQTMVNLKEKSH